MLFLQLGKFGTHFRVQMHGRIDTADFDNNNIFIEVQMKVQLCLCKYLFIYILDSLDN